MSPPDRTSAAQELEAARTAALDSAKRLQVAARALDGDLRMASTIAFGDAEYLVDRINRILAHVCMGAPK